MAKKILSDYDLEGRTIDNQVLQKRTTAELASDAKTEAMIKYNTTTKKAVVADGSAFNALVDKDELNDELAALEIGIRTDFDAEITDINSSITLKHPVFVGISHATPVLASDISINYTTRVLTINKTPFDIFVGDNTGGRIKITKTGGVNFPAFPNVSGIYYFYFDAITGNAVTTATPWVFGSIAPVYRILYNATQGGAAAEAFECHLNTISGDDHKWKHAGGTIYFNGFDLIHNALASGSPNADGRNTCIGITGGTNIDDNLSYTVVHNASPANVWEQDLGAQSAGSLNNTNGGQFRIKWDTAGEKWTLDATRFPFDFTGNEPNYITAAGVRTLVPNNNFFAYYCYAFQDPRLGQTIKLVSAVTPFTTIDEARAHTWETIKVSYPTLGDNEIKPLYKFIFEHKTTFPDSCKQAVLREFLDIRRAPTRTTSNVGGTLPASNVTVVATGNMSSTDVQSALVELQNDIDGLQFGAMIAAENIAVDKAVCVRVDAGVPKLYLANATDTTKMLAVGISVAAATANSTLIYRKAGVHTFQSPHGFTLSSLLPIYVGTTAGALVQTQPASNGNVIQPIGLPIADNKIEVMIGLIYFEKYV
jgi:hypothetical protein